MKKVFFLSLLGLFLGGEVLAQNKENSSKIFRENKNSFYEFFTPETSLFNSQYFDVRSAHKIGKNIFLIGNSLMDIGTMEAKEKEDYGVKLLVLNEKNQIQYRSRGQKDAMQYFPHFFKNKNGKILILCEIAFEYSAGLDIYLFENEKITYLGNMDIAPEKEDTEIKDFVKITEKNNQIEFSFNGKKLLLNPGGEKEQFIDNKKVKFIYKNGKLSFEK